MAPLPALHPGVATRTGPLSAGAIVASPLHMTELSTPAVMMGSQAGEVPPPYAGSLTPSADAPEGI